jgi:8-oxo-dGTP diphosphatase
MKSYVLGFMFNEDMTRVALIRKNRPTWQAGKLNGIGGHVEANEDYDNAMIREFFEETGTMTAVTDWNRFAELQSYDKTPEPWNVLVYFSKMFFIEELKTTTDEEVVIINVSELDEENVIPNLKWLIRLCFDNTVDFVKALYK